MRPDVQSAFATETAFAYLVFHAVKHLHNPFAMTWSGGRWQKISAPQLPWRNAIEVRVADGEDLEVVIRGILGDEL